MTIRDIYLVHHSHTDLGYTHSPAVATEMHCRFIDQALDQIDSFCDWPDDSRFRWTCESLAIVDRWFNRASSRQIDRFVSACQSELMEVTAMWCNITPLFDTEQLYQLAGKIEKYRSIGITVRSAMNSDVNGLPWGIVDLLLDMGIDGISMAINEYFGRAPFNPPSAFRWASPTGRSIPVWNGYLYNDGRHYGIPANIEKATTKIPELVNSLEARGYQHDFLMFQSTYPDFSDNGPPNPDLPPFVREWNRRGLLPRISICTLGQFLAHLQAPNPSLKEVRGEWADTWALGVASAARETMINRANHDRIIRAGTLQLAGLDDEAWLSRESTLISDALHSMSLYDEHTFGADVSVGDPDHPRVATEWCEKANTAHLGQSLTQLAERDGMIRLMNNIDHKGASGVLVYNPSPYTASAVAKIPQHWLTPPHPMALSHMLSPTGYGQLALHRPILRSLVADLPGWSYRWIPADQWVEHYDDTQGITATENSLESDSIRLVLDERTGGISSLIDKTSGYEYVDPSQGPLGAYTYETIDSSLGRRELFPHDWSQLFVSHKQWNRDWPAVRRGSVSADTATITRLPDRVSLCQKIQAPGLIELEYQYTIHTNRDGIEFEVTGTLPDVRSPHGIYLRFPFALDNTACHYESAGAIVDAHTEMMPETCRDFVTVQRWIDLSGSDHGIEIVTPDTPLWMIGDFCLGKLSDAHESKPTLIACLANNYWDTNFRVSQPGKLHFRFVICPHGPFNTHAATAISQAIVHDLITIPTTGQESGVWPIEGNLLKVEADSVNPISLTSSPDGRILLRLQSMSSTTERVRVVGTHTPIAGAWLANGAGLPINRLAFSSDYVEFDIQPREIRCILIDFK